MTSTLRFNLGDVRLRAEERRELQKLSRKLIELKANHYRVTESRLTARILAMRKINWWRGDENRSNFFDRTAAAQDGIRCHGRGS